MMKSISIIVPVYNEELSINSLYNQIKNVVETNFRNYEIIFIDDGSSDKSYNIISDLVKLDSNVVAIQMNRNYGKSDALNEGIKIVKYDIVATLDADLQDDPNELVNLISKLDEGWDCVSGWKKDRYDPISKTIPSFFFNKIVNVLSGLNLHDLNCGIKVYKQNAIKSLSLYGGLHRFIPLLLINNGYKVTEAIVKHRPREYGKTKYGNSRFFHGVFDFLTIFFLKKYFNRPMYFFGTIGFFLFSFGFIINLYLSLQWFSGFYIGNRPLFFLGILLILIGAQSLSIGLIGELIVNNSIQKNNKVKKIIDNK